MRHVILHGHIFKNAGTTFDWSLQCNFDGAFLDHREDKLMRQDDGEHILELLEDQPELCAISSHHMTRNLPRLVDLHFFRVSLLRHPLKRLRSVYDFERRQRGQTLGAKAAKRKSFRDYVEWRMRPDVPHTIRNYQTLYLSGHRGLTADEDLATHCFPAAMAFVRNDAMVGVVERYDESMVVLENILHTAFPDLSLAYVPQNVAYSKRDKAGAGKEVSDILKELGDMQQCVIDANSYDLALYQLGLQRLNREIATINDFSERLVDFRERCQHLSK